MKRESVKLHGSAELARKIRLRALEMISRSGSSHIGGVFSMAEIVAVLYEEILDITPEMVDSPDRDRFVLSKGHATAGLYAVLAEKEFFPEEWLESYYVDGAKLPSHASSGIPGVEVSSGSLGHGLSMGVGFALAAKLDKRNYRTFVLLGDGECDEGSVWEAAMFAAHHGLDNLTAVVDYNKMQAFGSVENVMGLEPFADKWTAFGWENRKVFAGGIFPGEESSRISQRGFSFRKTAAKKAKRRSGT